jgi:hypothetical protein
VFSNLDFINPTSQRSWVCVLGKRSKRVFKELFLIPIVDINPPKSSLKGGLRLLLPLSKGVGGLDLGFSNIL